MEIDSSPEPNLLSPQDRILRRLVLCGIPEERLAQLQLGLVDFGKENKSLVPQIVAAILPTNEDVLEALQEAARVKSGGNAQGPSLIDQFRESFIWLQWLMFEGEPRTELKNLAKGNVGQRGVCGAVWGHKDIAYRCRTCEHDPTCAICVPCFQNGNHKDHDYSIMYTGGGCCDCGDITAWKREGFCSRHKGAEQIQPLPEEIANSVELVLDALLVYWKDKLLSAESAKNVKIGQYTRIHEKVAKHLTSATVEMLLEFCQHSESLLSFVSQRMLLSPALMDILVKTERFLDKGVVRKLHELLLKLLGEPKFKYEFAKVFINYYPVIIGEAIKECSESESESEKYPLLSTFSVQIFTVPTLTLRLVREVNLLGMVLGSLGDLFLSCIGEDSHFQVSRLTILFDTTHRVVEDFRYVMSHVEVAKYVVQELPDISRTWMRLLALVQGMDSQKRVTGLHVEEENENLQTPFILGQSFENIHSVLVSGAFAVDDAELLPQPDVQDLDESDRMRHAKVGRLSLEGSVCSMMGRSSLLDCAAQGDDKYDAGGSPSIPFSVKWLVFECLKAIESSLGFNDASRRLPNSSSPGSTSSNGRSALTLRRSLLKVRNGGQIRRAFVRPSPSSPDVAKGALVAGNNISVDDIVIDPENASAPGLSDDSSLELDTLGVFSLKDWPEIIYDVSSQNIAIHIPLHRLLSLLLQKALERCYSESESSGDSGMINTASKVPLSGPYHNFFRQILGGCHPHGFSAFMMEHPLRLRVFCAQVRAGMWRKNGDAAIISSEYYRSIRWWGQALEFDLFLLQCCAALAPPDSYVRRVQERFGLSSYQSLNLELSNEYEPVLVQEMLTLIIQIVKERGLCGLSTAENLRRELVYRLSIGDATHSQLVKALPHEISKSNQLQETLNAIATYSNPSGLKQGKYSLAKAYWKELDLYHPRWNSRDLQTAEERYSRFCKVSALTVQLPQWTKVFHPLNTISRIATSKAVLEIIRAVLYYAVFTDTSSLSRAPDGVLLTALHLLSLALDICCVHKCDSSQSYVSVNEEISFPVLAYACEEIDVGSTNGFNAWRQQSMISLLVLLMRKYKKENEHIFIEANECNFASLIENLLKKLAELNAECMAKVLTLAPDLVSHMSPNNNGVKDTLSSSDAEERRAKVRERQAAMLEKMRAAQFKFIKSLETSEDKDLNLSKSKQEVSISGVNNFSEMAEPVVCSLCRDPDSKSPVSFLIFLQKSRLISFLERGAPSWEEVCQSGKEHLLLTRDQVSDPLGSETNDSSSGLISPTPLLQLVWHAVDEFSHDGQLAEVDAFLNFMGTRFPVIGNIQLPTASYDANTDILSLPEVVENDIYKSIQRGIHDIILHSEAMEDGQKFEPEEGPTKNTNGESAMLGEYIASLLRETSKHHPASSSEDGLSQNGNISSNATQIAPFDGFGPTDCDGIHISSCGHAVHQECRDRYLSSLKQRFTRRTVFERGYIVDPEQGELLCPVCRRLANAVLPVFSRNSNGVVEQMTLSCGSSTASCSDNNVLRLPLALSLLRASSNVVGTKTFLKSFSLQMCEGARVALQPIFRTLCRMYYPNRCDRFLASGRLSHSLILWDTLRYSLISTEIAARCGKSKMPVGGSKFGLEALYKELESSTGFVLSLLLQFSQTTRSQNRLQVLLRFRGIQLFTESICSGVSVDDFFTGLGSQRGNFSSILKHVDKGVVFPDTQFWKRAADPILSHDPFSSLMWVLFCLPLPFLSSTESFIPLVHLFYVVALIQAMIACRQNSRFDFSRSIFGDCLVRGVDEIIGRTEASQQYFVSSHIDTSCHPKDMVRRLTFPYLRRCALLWRLLSSAAAGPLYDRSHGWDRSSSFMQSDPLEYASDISTELEEVAELESMFSISSIEMVLNHELVQSLALKWCKHLCEEFGPRNYGRILHLSPVVPFKLVKLPHLYQDLLQRYIKQPCHHCNVVSEEPLLCLLCGTLCSSSSKTCCSESECQSHVISCGAGVGVFLMIRRTLIMLQRSARRSLYPSPYLDAFGEEDIDVHRGKPLYLNEERYATLTYMVASHGLDWNSEVLRQTTIGPF